MISVKYVNSNGTSIDLLGSKLRATEGYVHNRKWSPVVNALSVGARLKSFNKDPIQYDLTVALRGTLQERYAMMDNLLEAFEYDVIRKTPGRLWFGSSYIDCYVIESAASVGDLSTRTNVAFKVYCPYPFWISEKSKSFFPSQGEEPIGKLEYPYDYPYDYKADPHGSARWIIDHYADSEFKMTIHGPALNPAIHINGHEYKVFTNLLNDEYLTIDSRDNTIIKALQNGVKLNLLNDRSKTESVFANIPSGVLDITWSGGFGFDITLFLERSEPKWI